MCPIDSNSDSRVFGSLEQSSDSALRFGSAYNHLLVDSFISWKDPDYQPGTSDVEECPVIPHSQPVTNLAEKHLAFSPDSSESISTFIEANRVVSAESECGPCPQPASQAMNVAKKRGLFSRATKPNTVSVGDLSEMNESANGLAKAKGAPSSPSSVSGGIDSQDEDRFNGDGVMFHGKLIGHEYVAEARGEQMCQQSLKKLKVSDASIVLHFAHLMPLFADHSESDRRPQATNSIVHLVRWNQDSRRGEHTATVPPPGATDIVYLAGRDRHPCLWIRVWQLHHRPSVHWHQGVYSLTRFTFPA